MTTSQTFLPLLDSIRVLLRDYPIQADMTTVRVVNGERVVVQLATGDFGTVAAGMVEWDRTLAAGKHTIERSPDGATVTLGLAGHVDEDGTDVEVYGTTPYDTRRLGAELLPGETTAVPFEVLAVWAIGSGRVIP